MIIVDITKAQEITKARLRAERKPKLEALDVEMMKNISNPVALASIEAQKQALRDITIHVMGIYDLEALKALKVEA